MCYISRFVSAHHGCKRWLFKFPMPSYQLVLLSPFSCDLSFPQDLPLTGCFCTALETNVCKSAVIMLNNAWRLTKNRIRIVQLPHDWLLRSIQISLEFTLFIILYILFIYSRSDQAVKILQCV